MPPVQFLYISLETKPLKLTIEKKNVLSLWGHIFKKCKNT